MSTEQIVVYSGPNCHRCEQTVRLLNQQQLPHRVVNVHEDTCAMDHMKSLGYNSLPVVLAPNGTHWSGFDLMKLRALGQASATVVA